jgi:hypothetical protein
MDDKFGLQTRAVSLSNLFPCSFDLRRTPRVVAIAACKYLQARACTILPRSIQYTVHLNYKRTSSLIFEPGGTVVRNNNLRNERDAALFQELVQR